MDYASGAFSILRLYFIGSGDTKIIINTPLASYVCNDDSFVTRYSSIGFNTPGSDRHDVWIGALTQGESAGAH